MSISENLHSKLPVPSGDSNHKKSTGLNKWLFIPRYRNDIITAFLFLIPSFIIFGVFVYYALGFNIYLSFTSWNFLSKTKEFINLDNYIRLYSSKIFWRSVGSTVYFAIGSVSISMVIGLLLAILLNQKIPIRGFFRTIIFSPYVTTTAAISLLWIWIFQPDFGLINFGLELIGIDGPKWLSDTTWAMPALIIMEVWRHTGYVMVIFLAGLQNVPNELYEAAEIDGAGGWRKFLNVTLPLLSPTTFFLLITSLLSSFNTFDQVQVMTKGGPAGSTTVFNYFIYEQAFVNFRAGYAATASTTLFFILLLITIFQMVASRRWVYYSA